MHRMLVAITGATGFVGRHLVELHRQRGDMIRILKRPATAKVPVWHDIEVVDGDLAAGERLLERFVAGVDVLYHCAGEIRDERAMAMTNVDGTRALASAAAGRIKHWVQLSSAAVYGGVRDGLVTEESVLAPDTTYGKTKLESELIVRSAAASGAFTCSVLRPTAIFGADMPGNALFRLISMIDKGLFFFIGQAGAIMNFVHVDNIVSALTLCATHPAAVGHDYIVSEELTIEQVVDILSGEMGRPVPRLRFPLMPVRTAARIAGMLPFSPVNTAQVDALAIRARYSIKSITRELAYSPVTRPEAGLRELVATWKKRRNNAP